MRSNLQTWVSGRAAVLILAAGSVAFAMGCHHEHHDEGYGYGGGYGGGYGDAGYHDRRDYHDRGDRGYGDRGDEHRY